MPISYRIDEARRLVLTTATGVLTDADILGLKAALQADPHRSPEMRELADIRSIDRLDVTGAGVQQMAARDASVGSSLASYRLAIVAPRDEVYGMARMYQLLTEHTVPHVGVFRDLEAATAWLEAS